MSWRGAGRLVGTRGQLAHHRDLTKPLGIDSSQPLLGWVIASAARGASQSKYEIRVARSENNLARGQNLLWDSRVVNSGKSFDVPYGGPALTSRTRYYWQVRVWDNDGSGSGWSNNPASLAPTAPRPGANTIAVAATNAGGPGSWIGNLGLQYPGG